MTQTPPHSPEAEAWLLANLILDPQARETYIHAIQAEDFYIPWNGKLFGAIADLHDKAGPMDPEPIADLMGKDWDAEKYMTMLADHYASAPDYWLRRCRQLRMLRGVMSTAAKLTDNAGDSTKSPTELIRDAGAKLEDVNALSLDEGESIEVTLQRLLAQMEQGKTPAIASGYSYLDHVTGGMWPGELTMLAGRASMGKSTLALNIACNLLRHGLGVLVFSCEMGREQLLRNIIIHEGALNNEHLRVGKLTDDEWRTVSRVAARVSRWPLVIDDRAPVNLHTLLSKAAAEHKRKPLSLIVVDYLQRVKGPRAERQDIALGYIASELKALAERLYLPVLAVAQLNRMPENRNDAWPKMSDLRGSGELEQDADNILLMHRPGYYDKDKDNNGETFLIIAKQRNGATDTVKLQFLAERCAFITQRGGSDAAR